MKVTFKRLCGCVNKIDLKETTEFETKEDAISFANQALNKLELTSCSTHRFFIEDVGKEDEIFINSELDDDAFSLKMK
ncbi:MAG: hypothetical protein OIF32_05425 [Campylobacterales bacterium]|nr:hypothetical protein [Campylobacterales bacterium]